jgi:hypothetical protein
LKGSEPLSNPLVLALASRRLTQLVVEDEITRPIRIAVSQWAAEREEFSFRERVDYMLNCGQCASIYAAAAVLVASRVPGGSVLLRLLALSEAAMLIEAFLKRLER